jgi:hypothetical protein
MKLVLVLSSYAFQKEINMDEQDEWDFLVGVVLS